MVLSNTGNLLIIILQQDLIKFQNVWYFVTRHLPSLILKTKCKKYEIYHASFIRFYYYNYVLRIALHPFNMLFLLITAKKIKNHQKGDFFPGYMWTTLHLLNTFLLITEKKIEKPKNWSFSNSQYFKTTSSGQLVRLLVNVACNTFLLSLRTLTSKTSRKTQPRLIKSHNT